MNATQIEFFQKDEKEELFPYWREQLKEWPGEVFSWRHRRNTTGWSMCCHALMFARLLYRHGQMDKKEFKRWWKFDIRVMHWDSFPDGVRVPKRQ